MKRHRHWLLLLVCLFGGILNAHAVQTTVPVQVEYRQATDVFNLLDNLPNWLPGYTAAAYGDYWRAHLGLDKADLAALNAYAAFRQRTSPAAQTDSAAAASAPDLFAPPSTRDIDPFAKPFFEAADLDTAVTAVIAAQAPRDRAVLRDYFSRFGPRAEHLIASQARFATQRKALASQLDVPGVPALAEAIRKFYGVGEAPAFIVRFVWWPDANLTQAKVRGRYILLQGSADGAEKGSSMDWAPIVLHEYTHYVSAGQPTAQRQRLSAAFLHGCPAAATLPNPLNAFEEPLAIYWGQYRFEQDVRGRVLPVTSDWYVRPMPDHIAKAIAATFPASGPVPSRDDPALMLAATKTCLRQTSRP